MIIQSAFSKWATQHVLYILNSPNTDSGKHLVCLYLVTENEFRLSAYCLITILLILNLFP